MTFVAISRKSERGSRKLTLCWIRVHLLRSLTVLSSVKDLVPDVFSMPFLIYESLSTFWIDIPVEGCWCSGIRPNTRFTDDTDLDNSALPLFRTTLNLLPFIWFNIIVLIPHVLEGNNLGIFSQKETPLGLCNSLYSRLDFSLLTNLFKISLILGLFFFFPPNPSK